MTRIPIATTSSTTTTTTPIKEEAEQPQEGNPTQKQKELKCTISVVNSTGGNADMQRPNNKSNQNQWLKGEEEIQAWISQADVRSKCWEGQML